MMEWMSYGISVKMSFYVNLILNLNDLCYTRLHTVVNRMEILVILWIMQAKFFMSSSALDPSTKSVTGLLNPNLKKTWGKILIELCIPIFFSKQTNLKIRHLDIGTYNTHWFVENNKSFLIYSTRTLWCSMTLSKPNT